MAPDLCVRDKAATVSRKEENDGAHSMKLTYTSTLNVQLGRTRTPPRTFTTSTHVTLHRLTSNRHQGRQLRL